MPSPPTLRGVREIGWRSTLITAGGLNGILNVLLAVLEPGDEVVLTDPVYAGLLNRVRVAGGVPGSRAWNPARGLEPRSRCPARRSRRSHAGAPDDGPVDADGHVLDREAWEAVAALCRERDLLLVVDTAMERLLFDGRELVDPLALDGMGSARSSSARPRRSSA